MSKQEDLCVHRMWTGVNGGNGKTAYGMIDCANRKWTWRSWNRFIYCPTCGRKIDKSMFTTKRF